MFRVSALSAVLKRPERGCASKHSPQHRPSEGGFYWPSQVVLRLLTEKDNQTLLAGTHHGGKKRHVRERPSRWIGRAIMLCLETSMNVGDRRAEQGGGDTFCRKPHAPSSPRRTYRQWYAREKGGKTLSRRKVLHTHSSTLPSRMPENAFLFNQKHTRPSSHGVRSKEAVYLHPHDQESCCHAMADSDVSPVTTVRRRPSEEYKMVVSHVSWCCFCIADEEE